MPGPRRCFSTASALQRLNPVLLCDVLSKFPDYLKERGLRLPANPSEDTLDYEAIRAACMHSDMPADLDDVLSYTSILGTIPGWERVKAEARSRGKRLDFCADHLTHADLVMKAWLWDWPNNRSLLEESHARARIHARSSYVYFPPVRDVRSQFKSPTSAGLAKLREELTAYFVAEGLGKGSNIVRFEFEKEIWFLIRYPGRLKRQVKIDDDGAAASVSFKPAEYDVVVYHKVYGDLRMNTKRIRDRRKYRIAFGHALLACENLFAPDARVITLEPLKGQCLGLFHCGDIEGLAEIAPVEVEFSELDEKGRIVRWAALNDTTLLTFNRLGDLLLPADTDTVRCAKFRYRFRNRPKYDVLTVHQGDSMTFERDGDSAVLEEWLRSRKFFNSTMEKR